MNFPTRAAWAAWLGYLSFVVYGSLVPLDWRPMPLDQAIAAYKAMPFLALGVASRADWIANAVLYVPLAALGVLALGGGRARPLAMAGSLAVAVALAFAVEFAQLFFPPRTVSQNDLLAETLGSVLGVAVAPRLGGWAARARALAGTGFVDRLPWLLSGYAVLYLAYSFFPYDLLISRAEWAERLAGPNIGWWLARTEGGSLLRTLLQLAAEVLMCLPLGAALRLGRPLGWPAAAACGALLGVVIEAGQLALASGVSQGASVLARALGMAAGAWLWPRLQAAGVAPLRRWIAAHAPWLALPWLMLLPLASGWASARWGGLEHAARAWAGTRLQPFYYHYFTTEAAALSSLASVVAMYLPLAVLAWARHWAVGAAVSAAVAVAMGIEAGKLFVPGLHADPTNVLLAALSVGLATTLLRWKPAAASAPVPAGRTPDVSAPASAAGEVPPRRAVAEPVLAGLAVLLPAAWALTWPPTGPALALAIVAGAALAAWRPLWGLAALLAALPVLDFAPWSGTHFLDEFDLVATAWLAVAAWRAPAGAGRPRRDLATLAFGAFGLSWGVSLLLGIVGAASPWDFANLGWHPHSPLAGLRLAKGALWALVFAALYRRLVDGDERRALVPAAGFALGLLPTLALIVWERLAFVGDLADFGAIYRVTGPFSAMHTGGAYVECWLAVAAAFVLAGAVGSGRRLLLAAAALLLVPTAYAVFVTYSRNGWAALAGVLALVLLSGLRQRVAAARGMALVALAGGVGTGLLVLGGSFAQSRLAQSAQDLHIRAAHWADALAMHSGPLETLLGAGIARFPERHAWASREPRAAGLRLDFDDNAYLRLGSGAVLYVEQIVHPRPGQPLGVTLNLRSDAGAPSLAITLCRKWMLSSSDCTEATLKGGAHPGIWQTLDADLPALPPPQTWAEALAPVKLSLLTPAQGRSVDVDNVNLYTDTQRDLVRNGGFVDGLDRWFTTTDLDPPWHVHSLPVSLWFEQGLVGLVLGLALAAVALAAGARAAWRGSAAGLAAFAAYGAFWISGLLNTLVDEPRFLFLWLVLAWLCVHWGRCTPGRRRGDAPADGAAP